MGNVFGGLEKTPFGFHFLASRGVEFPQRCFGIACGASPTEKSGNEIVWVPYVRFYPLVSGLRKTVGFPNRCPAPEPFVGVGVMAFWCFAMKNSSSSTPVSGLNRPASRSHWVNETSPSQGCCAGRYSRRAGVAFLRQWNGSGNSIKQAKNNHFATVLH